MNESIHSFQSRFKNEAKTYLEGYTYWTGCFHGQLDNQVTFSEIQIYIVEIPQNA